MPEPWRFDHGLIVLTQHSYAKHLNNGTNYTYDGHPKSDTRHHRHSHHVYLLGYMFFLRLMRHGLSQYFSKPCFLNSSLSNPSLYNVEDLSALCLKRHSATTWSVPTPRNHSLSSPSSQSASLCLHLLSSTPTRPLCLDWPSIFKTRYVRLHQRPAEMQP